MLMCADCVVVYADTPTCTAVAVRFTAVYRRRFDAYFVLNSKYLWQNRSAFARFEKAAFVVLATNASSCCYVDTQQGMDGTVGSCLSP